MDGTFELESGHLGSSLSSVTDWQWGSRHVLKSNFSNVITNFGCMVFSKSNLRYKHQVGHPKLVDIFENAGLNFSVFPLMQNVDNRPYAPLQIVCYPEIKKCYIRG